MEEEGREERTRWQTCAPRGRTGAEGRARGGASGCAGWSREGARALQRGGGERREGLREARATATLGWDGSERRARVAAAESDPTHLFPQRASKRRKPPVPVPPASTDRERSPITHRSRPWAPSSPPS